MVSDISFDLSEVTWGYREIFRQALDDLRCAGFLGDETSEVSDVLVEMLNRRGGNQLYDHVLKNFLDSLNRGDSWILRIPDLFSAWAALGADFARHKLHLGMKYFELWGQGSFGENAEDVSYVLCKAREMFRRDKDLAFAFVCSFGDLRARLNYGEIDVFVECAFTIRQNSAASAEEFIRLNTKTSLLYVDIISKESRLEAISDVLRAYASAIAGIVFEVNPVSMLDSDELIESGSSVVCIQGHLFLPGRVALRDSKKENIAIHKLLSCIAASSLLFRSFPVRHGEPGAGSSLECLQGMEVADPVIFNNCFIFLETCRVLKCMMETFPGVVKELADTISAERARVVGEGVLANYCSMIEVATCRKSNHETDIPLELERLVKDVMAKSCCFEDTIEIISKHLGVSGNRHVLGDLFSVRASALSYFPDFMFRGHVTAAPSGLRPPDIGDERLDNPHGADDSADRERVSVLSADDKPGSAGGRDEDREDAEIRSFSYDEWNHHENDYYENWCTLRERRLKATAQCSIPEQYERLAVIARRLFESLRPDNPAKLKRLPEGDNINVDHFTDFMSHRKAKIWQQPRFYEKTSIRRRDISVALLIDFSGSTADDVTGGEKVIDLEKVSAYILGEGLSGSGDPFGVFGFNGNGREKSDFFVIKDFEDSWSPETRCSIFGARPAASTRIGVALRHAGSKLGRMPARRKLMILITDGRPMDTGYDPGSGYAQNDVRKAVEENMVNGIDTFCISTRENPFEDLDLMFPLSRYVVVSGMEQLPSLLPKFYLRLTR
ncbi:MAG: hypothetical protein JW808_02355 [Victivallales bacterium]|nr:hypothetical protein [Victivallales bacterium]